MKNKKRREQSSPDSTLLAHPTILLPAIVNAKAGTNDNPSECKKSVQSGQFTIRISNSSKDGFNGMLSIEQKLINDGLSKESIDINISSWRSNTSKKYNTYIKQWIKFCKKSNRDLQNATIKDDLVFLTNLFQHKKNYLTISCAQSLLPLFIIYTGNNVEFGKQQIVQKYMKGTFHLKPSLPKYILTL